jgi:TM2 domain-containing membrane protein YozV
MAESANKPGEQPTDGAQPVEPGPDSATVPTPPGGPEPGFAATLPSHQPDPTAPGSPLDPTAAFPATATPQPPPTVPPVPPAVPPFPEQSSAYGEAGVAPEAGTAPATWPAPAPPSPPTGAAPGHPPTPAYQPSPGYPQYDPVTGRPLSDKSKIVAGLLQIFLGSFGIGRFYTGHTGIAVAQLVVSICTLGIGGVWGLVDGIILLINGGTDAQGRVLRD